MHRLREESRKLIKRLRKDRPEVDAWIEGE